MISQSTKKLVGAVIGVGLIALAPVCFAKDSSLTPGKQYCVMQKDLMGTNDWSKFEACPHKITSKGESYVLVSYESDMSKWRCEGQPKPIDSVAAANNYMTTDQCAGTSQESDSNTAPTAEKFEMDSAIGGFNGGVDG